MMATSHPSEPRPDGMQELRYLFVYGTLMLGMKNDFANLLESHASFEGPATAHGRLFLSPFSLPLCDMRLESAGAYLWGTLRTERTGNSTYLSSMPTKIGTLPARNIPFRAGILPRLPGSPPPLPGMDVLLNQAIDQLIPIASGNYRDFLTKTIEPNSGAVYNPCQCPSGHSSYHELVNCRHDCPGFYQNTPSRKPSTPGRIRESCRHRGQLFCAGPTHGCGGR